jgi:hypothetical protein
MHRPLESSTPENRSLPNSGPDTARRYRINYNSRKVPSSGEEILPFHVLTPEGVDLPER